MTIPGLALQAQSIRDRVQCIAPALRHVAAAAARLGGVEGLHARKVPGQAMASDWSDIVSSQGSVARISGRLYCGHLFRKHIAYHPNVDLM